MRHAQIRRTNPARRHTGAAFFWLLVSVARGAALGGEADPGRLPPAAQRTVENENALIEAVLDAMWRTPGVRRVESQLMMLSAPFGRPVPFPERFHSYPRCFLEAPLAGVERFAPRDLPGISISLWQENRQDDTARLIANSYQGHIDSHINDQ